MKFFDKKALMVLTTTPMWDEFRCFGSAVSRGGICEAITSDKFCPLKESCIARSAEVLNLRPVQELDSTFEYRLNAYSGWSEPCQHAHHVGITPALNLKPTPSLYAVDVGSFLKWSDA